MNRVSSLGLRVWVHVVGQAPLCLLLGLLLYPLLNLAFGLTSELMHVWFWTPSYAMVTKALSCREELQWLKKNNYKKVLIETDSLLLVTTVNSSGNYISHLGMIIQDYKDLLQAIPDSSLIFVRRSTNRAAHALARGVGSRSSQGAWVGYPPISLMVVISKELSY